MVLYIARNPRGSEGYDEVDPSTNKILRSYTPRQLEELEQAGQTIEYVTTPELQAEQAVQEEKVQRQELEEARERIQEKRETGELPQMYDSSSYSIVTLMGKKYPTRERKWDFGSFFSQ